MPTLGRILWFLWWWFYLAVAIGLIVGPILRKEE
jgi:hypothetical protein